MERGRSKRSGREARYTGEERNGRELRSGRGDRYGREEKDLREETDAAEEDYDRAQGYDREEGQAGEGRYSARNHREGKHNPYQGLFEHPGKGRDRVRRRTFEDDLESLELIRERFPVSYRKAKEVLDMAGGEVTEAIAYLEETAEDSVDYLDEAIERTTDYLQERGSELTHQFRGFWDWANNSAVTVRRGDEVMARIPASVGLVGLVGTLFSSRLAVVGAIGLATVLSSGYNLELDSTRNSFDH
ncbi:MAG: DUF4342 domain-containing protein [Clostridia bacterium]|nr:DUF4342 domain-containing protein [Clostridia bacterium]